MTLAVVLQCAVVTWACAPATAAARSGDLGPQQIRRAYGLPVSGAPGQTVAIVVSYHDPAISADLASYSSTYGLKSCATSTGCLREVNGEGKSSPLPGPDPTGGNWNTEAALSSEIVHGVCVGCKILLVEAPSPSKADLSAAVSTAARLGAQVIETSFTPPEESTDWQYAGDYVHQNSIVVAATGDGGYNGSGTFPSSLPGVLAVGGTKLTLAGSGAYEVESAWALTTSACSLYSSTPSWQVPFAASVGCDTKRATADISAMADPGASVHIMGAGVAGGPWYTATGTSLAAPIIAGAVALAGGGGSALLPRLYERARIDPGAFHDVTTGSNSPTCDSKPICSARPGFDGPTGLGSPNGLAAFTPSLRLLDPRSPGVSASNPRGGIRLGKNWTGRVALLNRNGFALSVAATVRSTNRIVVGGRLQRVTLASGSLALTPHSSTGASLQVPPRYRAAVRRLHSLAVKLTLRLRDATGHTATVTVSRRLYAP